MHAIKSKREREDLFYFQLEVFVATYQLWRQQGILGHVLPPPKIHCRWSKMKLTISVFFLRTQPQQPWSSLLPSFPSPLRHLPSPPLVLPLPPDRLHLVVLSVRLLPPFPSVVKRKFIYFLQWHKLYMNNNVVWTIAMDLLLYCNSLSSDKSLLSFIYIYIKINLHYAYHMHKLSFIHSLNKTNTVNWQWPNKHPTVEHSSI